MSLWSIRKKQQSKSETIYSYHELKNMVCQMLNEYTGMQVADTGLSEGVFRNQEEYRRMLSNCIRICCSGNYGAKETVKELIRAYLIRNLAMDEAKVYRLLPFDVPENLTGREMMEILVYKMDGKEEMGFKHLWEKAGWGKEKECTIITEDMVRVLFVTEKPQLDFCDSMMVLSQLLFADTVGLGVIDTINQQKGCIEEIQLGMNGFAEGVYNYKSELTRSEEIMFYGRDGIHVLIGGKTVWLKFLSFGTGDELQRVLRNLIRDSQAGELTRNHPMIVVDTVDGRRVSVSRPPMTDSWVGLIRKFDTIAKTTLEKLYENEVNGKMLSELIRYLVRSGRNIAITGEMASGKTTLFRACLKETSEDRNLRIIEADSFELNVRNFLPARNSMTMRITYTTPTEEVLAFARKTTGQIFAIGEINSAAVAIMMMDLSKIATQLFFSAHYVSTEQMITDFVNAKLCVGGYAEEKLAKLDVISSLGFDIHLQNRFGKRCVQYINEVVPKEEILKGEKEYQIRQIYYFDEETNQGVFAECPSVYTFARAKEEMSREDYLEFSSFFATKEDVK